MSIPPTTAVTSTASQEITFPGVNPLDLDNVEEGFRWMLKGRVDSTGLAKHFPHTARDLREGKVSPEQLAKSLGAIYARTPTTLLGDSSENEMSLSMFIACRLTAEALPTSGRQQQQQQQLDISIPFSNDLENHFKEQALRASSSIDSLVGAARAALRTTCAEWSRRLDDELFHGLPGSFLRLCPMINHSPSDFERVYDAVLQGVDWQESVNDQHRTTALKNYVEIAARGIVEGAHEAKTTCWQYETGVPMRVALYCSRQCQESAWNGGHKKKCKDLGVKYGLYTTSVAAVDAAHEMGVMHGIQLNDTVDYNILSFIYIVPVFGEEEAENNVNSKIPAGPSMETFYENLGRVVRGAWWFYIDADSKAAFRSKCTKKAETQYFLAMAILLCYDFFGYTAAKFDRDDPAFVTSHFGQWSFISGLTEKFGATMSAEVFLEIYEKETRRSADIVDRKRLRRQQKIECLMKFRNKFHK